MDSERLGRIQGLFNAALGRPVAERRAFLAEACPDDAELRREIESLLEADAAVQQEGFLEAPAALGFEPGRDPEAGHEGRHIGAYTVLRPIGRGGMGSVYLARRDDIDKQVAVKLLRSHLPSAAAVQRFLLERRLLARLEHPHVARLLDAGMTEDGAPYFVMEYIEGAPLTEHCERRRLSLAQRLEVFADVCEAVEYAHQNLIVHRDLKPQNILVDESGSVKLLDFGIAKLLHEDEPDLTRTGMLLMTPQYAAPEQMRGEPATPATDVYALGLLLYELLTGRRPYELAGRSAAEAERIVCNFEPSRPSAAVGQPPSERQQPVSTSSPTEPRDASGFARGPAAATEIRRKLWPGGGWRERGRRLQGDLDTICLKALAKEPARRYPTAGHLLEDLWSYLEGRPIRARPITLGYRLNKFVRRHRIAVSGLGLVLLSLFGGLGAALWQAGQARLARERAEQALARSEAVTSFLTGLFRASDPEEARGEEITARELLERGVAKAEQLASQPEAQGQMLQAIGCVYQSLGLHDKAQAQLERALEVRRKALGPDHADIATSLNDLGLLLSVRGQSDRAEPLCTEGLEMRRRLFEPEHKDVVTSLGCLAAVAFDRGDFQAAEPIHRLVLELDRKRLGNEHQEIALDLNNLAVVLSRQGKTDEAEALSRQALDLRRKLLPDPHPDLARSLNNVAVALSRKGKLDEAAALYREALAMRRKLLGPEHWEVALTMANLAADLRRQGVLEEAEALCREALAMDLKLLGPDDFYVGWISSNLADVLVDRQQYAEAESLYQQALAIFRKRKLSDTHREVQSVFKGLASVYEATGKPEQAGQYRALLKKP